MALAPGTRLGPYEIAAQIGAGGMGEVYRATDTNLKRAVAIKVLPAALASDSERLARFQREAEVLASLNHPNIAQIHGLEKSDGITALVMELVEGSTLAERIRNGPLDIDETLPIAKQIAGALEAAHDRGIIHRDLKPANVKVQPDGTVKVLDFGLAKAMETGGTAPNASQSPTITTPAMTEAGIILGTAAYMSPEQARGKPVDKRCDIWAFGCVLYEMTTAHRAFPGEDVGDTLAAVVKLEPNWDALPATLPRSVARVMRQCLRKDLRQRMHDIADVRLALEEPFETGAPATTGRSTERGTGWRRAAPWVAGGILGVLAGVGGFAILADRRAEQALVSRFALPFNPGQPGPSLLLALSADGRTLVYRAVGSDGIYRLYQRSIDQLEAMPIADTENAGGPFFSPDGRWIGFFVGSELKKVSLAGGRSETIAKLPAPARGANWDTADTIVVGAGPSGLLEVPAAGGDPVSLAAAGGGQELWYPQRLPGNRAVLFTESEQSPAGAGAPTLRVLEVDSGRRRTLLPGLAGRFVPTGHLVFVRGATLWAVGFDPDRLEVSGSPMPVVEGLRTGAVVQIALSDQGVLAYVPATGATERRMVWVDRDGREEAIDAPIRAYTYPRLSPDGARVALDVRGENIDIWMWDFARETLTRLTFDPAQDEYPVWTHDGQGVLFASFRDGAWGVFSQPADGTGTARRVATAAREIDPVSLSPDGRSLVVTGAGNLGVVTLGGGEEVSPLLDMPFVERNGDISPNGRLIAYQSDESGRHEIYVRPFPAVDSGRWQVSGAGGTHPLWARDGGELFFLSPDGLMSAPVRTDSGFDSGTASVVLKDALNRYWLSTVGRPYDVSLDGKRFLMLKDDESSAQVHVVVNWFAELTRLVPAR